MRNCLLVADDARPVERVLYIARSRRSRRRSALRAPRGRQLPKSPGSSTASSIAPARQDAREPRRRAHDVGDQPSRAGWLQAARTAGSRPAAGEERSNGQRVIGRRCRPKRLEQHRLNLGQPLARARRASPVAAVCQPRIAAMSLGGSREAQPRRAPATCGVVDLAGEHQLPPRVSSGACSRTARRSGLHASAARRAARVKATRVGKAEEAARPLQLLVVLGQRMRLLVGDHLQPVLDPAQEADRPRSVAGARYPAAAASRRERLGVSRVASPDCVRPR